MPDCKRHPSASRSKTERPPCCLASNRHPDRPWVRTCVISNHCRQEKRRAVPNGDDSLAADYLFLLSCAYPSIFGLTIPHVG